MCGYWVGYFKVGPRGMLLWGAGPLSCMGKTFQGWVLIPLEEMSIIMCEHFN